MVDDAGTALGFVAVFLDEEAREVTADVYVSPDADDVVWDVLLDHAQEYAAARVVSLAPDEAARWTMAAGSYVQDVRYASALRRHAFEVVRRFHSMGITFDPADPPRVSRHLPAGVTLAVAGDDEGLQRTAVELADVAFREHWNHVSHGYDEDINRGSGTARSTRPSGGSPRWTGHLRA